MHQHPPQRQVIIQLHRATKLDMTACSRTTTSQLSKFALFLPPLLFYIDPRSSPRQTDNPSFLDSVWTRAVRVLFLFTAFADIKAFVTYSCEDDSIRGQQEKKKYRRDWWCEANTKHAVGKRKKKKKVWVVWWFICWAATANENEIKSKCMWIIATWTSLWRHGEQT